MLEWILFIFSEKLLGDEIMEDFTVIILAAGEGKRMKSKHSKVTHKILGKSMIEWVYNAVKKAGAADCIVVVGHRADEVRECLGEKVKYAIQEQQLGTGHAVMQVVPYLKEKEDGYVMIMCGDMPLISSDTIKNAIKKHIEDKNAVTILTAEFDDPTGYGRIVKNGDKVIKIIEEKDATPQEKNIKEVNSGLYCFNVKPLIEALQRITNNNNQKEYYLTDTIEILINQGEKVETYKIKDNYEIMGINDKIQLSQAVKILRKNINETYMKSGVIIIDPDTTYIEPNVEIGIDVVIYPGTIIEGKSIIEEDCVIGPYTRIVNSTVKKGAKVQNSVVLESVIGESSCIGPFAYLRPGSIIGKEVKIGDFVEVKNSVIGDKTKVSHLSYIGDCDVGANVNVGCGTIVVNYDGRKKHRSIIRDNAFIGCNTNLISPVEVESNSYIAAGSTITHKVPENSLAIARARQEIKKDWVLKRGLIDKKE